MISFDSRQDAISGIYTFKNILRDPNDVRYNEGCVCVRVRVRVRVCACAITENSHFVFLCVRTNIVVVIGQ